jgi:hypothetical protein
MTINELIPDPKNANKGTKRGNQLVERSLREYGAGRSILIDKHGTIIAGNKTVANAQAAGLEDVMVIQSDGTKLIAVQRTDLDMATDSKAKALAIADNRTAEIGLDWDSAILGELAGEMDLQPFFTDKELSELLPETDIGNLSEYAHPISDDRIIDAAFNHFRATGFPYRNLPLHVSMQELNQLATTDPESLIGTNAGYQIADTYHPHRLLAAATKMKSPFESFGNDKLLRRAIKQELESGKVPAGYFGFLSFVSGTQACSNFRPGFACHLYRTYCKPGAVVLDTSTGYGGRLIGFLASGLAGKYIGIDPNTLTHAGNAKLASDLGFQDDVELYNLPAEDVDIELVRNRCDFAFTSPPYFCKEIYSSEGTQSCNRYSTGEDWRIGFLVPMLRLQFAALKAGATSIINIADVNIGSATYPLAEWTRSAAKEVGFQYIKTDEFPMQHRVGAGMGDEVATEPVIVLVKP